MGRTPLYKTEAERIEAKRKYHREYARSSRKDPETRKKHSQAVMKYYYSEKGQEKIKRYNQSNSRKKVWKKYYESEGFKKSRLKWINSKEGKESTKKGAKKYKQSEHGKIKAKEYRQSPKGREIYYNYKKSESGKEVRRKAEKKYRIKKKITSPAHKLRWYMASRIYIVLKRRGIRKSSRTLKLVGCTSSFLKSWLEKKFKPGMSWKNYGKWHVDHIRPCASFDLNKLEEQKKAFHYSNLQPLWAHENQLKSDKWDNNNLK